MKKPFILVYLIFVLAAGCAFGQCTTSQISPCINAIASRQFGQSPNAGALNQQLGSGNPNLVEGREFFAPDSIAFDKTANIMYVADTGNNRVLAFQNPNNLTPCGISAPTCGFANIVIGQNNFYSTLAGGGTAFGRPGLTQGFALPTGVAVDGNGNLYVVDSGNNRVVRFPRANILAYLNGVIPVAADLVIGQKTVNSGISPNQNLGVPSASSLSLNNNPSGIAIDASNNVWIADTGNNRVLRFPATNLVANNNLPLADTVLGQQGNFTTNTPPASNPQLGAGLSPNLLQNPVSIAIDNFGAGRLYVSDAYGRVLFYPNPTSGANASTILGIYISSLPPTEPPTNQYGLGSSLTHYCGLFTNGTNLFVVDAGNNRIVEYDQPQNWGNLASLSATSATIQFSPPMIAVIGQTGFNANSANQGIAPYSEPTASTLNFTVGFGAGAGAGAFGLNGTDMWIADTGNNRVISIPLTGNAYLSATRLVGQVDFPYFQPNLIEGRELFLVSPASTGGDVAVDLSTNSSAPHLYIADTFNNRILGFKDARNVQPGQRADLVIGQGDESIPGSAFYRGIPNFPKGDPQIQTQTGLNQPSGVVVDANGDLWVADSGNFRVLRFKQPFNQAGYPQPNLVLGQPGFTNSVQGTSQAGMQFPIGLAVFSTTGSLPGAIAVSDPNANRILIFTKPAGGDFSSGQAASLVLGQASFFTSATSNALSGLNSPRHMAIDSNDRLYVADIGNNRMVVYNSPPATGANAAFALNGVQALGVAVSGNGQTDAGTGSGTGEIFLALSNEQVWKYPVLEQLEAETIGTSAPQPEQAISLQANPTALTLDRSGNLVVADSADRVVFFYPQLNYAHAANMNTNPIAPGQLTYLFRAGLPFSFNDYVSTSYPWPTTAEDVQVTVAGIAAPIYLIINEGPYLAIQVPTTVPTTGNAQIVVTHPSTGEILGTASVPMGQYNPGFFTINDSGAGQVSALNAVDQTPNSSTNPVSRAGTASIEFCLTGGGVFSAGPDAPPADGMPYTGKAGAKTPVTPQLSSDDGFLPSGLVTSTLITYSGAGLPGQGCDFPGGYQITLLVPNTVTIDAVAKIAVTLGGVAQTVPGNVTYAAH